MISHYLNRNFSADNIVTPQHFVYMVVEKKCSEIDDYPPTSLEMLAGGEFGRITTLV